MAISCADIAVAFVGLIFVSLNRFFGWSNVDFELSLVFHLHSAENHVLLSCSNEVQSTLRAKLKDSFVDKGNEVSLLLEH